MAPTLEAANLSDKQDKKESKSVTHTSISYDFTPNILLLSSILFLNFISFVISSEVLLIASVLLIIVVLFENLNIEYEKKIVEKDNSTEDSMEESRIDEIKNKYATGEITDEELENKIEEAIVDTGNN